MRMADAQYHHAEKWLKVKKLIKVNYEARQSDWKDEFV
ncbi:MAG: hypothetical protein CM15mV114_130 [Caudoviricetes sp.]|nr:MAG: hypothetical protein CM15mV114_130 [Caudoviricetes sp.]